MYHVVYYDNGIRKEGDYSGSAKELRSRLAAEGKVVIKVHSSEFSTVRQKARIWQLCLWRWVIC